MLRRRYVWSSTASVILHLITFMHSLDSANLFFRIPGFKLLIAPITPCRQMSLNRSSFHAHLWLHVPTQLQYIIVDRYADKILLSGSEMEACTRISRSRNSPSPLIPLPINSSTITPLSASKPSSLPTLSGRHSIDPPPP